MEGGGGDSVSSILSQKKSVPAAPKTTSRGTNPSMYPLGIMTDFE